MKITNVGLNPMIKAYNQTKPKDKVETKSTKKDSVTVSDKAKDFGVAMKGLANADIDRPDKVAAIRERMEKGEYKVSAEDIADRMIANARFSVRG